MSKCKHSKKERVTPRGKERTGKDKDGQYQDVEYRCRKCDAVYTERQWWV